MSHKMSWEEIQNLFDQEWVELTDYEWDGTEPYPSAGIVRSHAADRKVLSEQVRSNPVDDSAILFVGEWKLPHDAVVNFNKHRLVLSEK